LLAQRIPEVQQTAGSVFGAQIIRLAAGAQNTHARGQGRTLLLKAETSETSAGYACAGSRRYHQTSS